MPMRAALLLILASLWFVQPASAEGISLTPERQAWLEGVWSGLPTDVSADKLCSRIAPPAGATTLAIEFERTGGVRWAVARRATGREARALCQQVRARSGGRPSRARPIRRLRRPVR
jgi:hypothetical protein